MDNEKEIDYEKAMDTEHKTPDPYEPGMATPTSDSQKANGVTEREYDTSDSWSDRQDYSADQGLGTVEKVKPTTVQKGFEKLVSAITKPRAAEEKGSPAFTVVTTSESAVWSPNVTPNKDTFKFAAYTLEGTLIAEQVDGTVDLSGTPGPKAVKFTDGFGTEYLNVNNLSITSMDISALTNLVELDAGSNALSTLNVDKAQKLTKLHINGNAFSGAAIDELLIALDKAETEVGTLNYTAQVGDDTPTIASRPAYDSLVNKHWKIIGEAPPKA